MMLRVGSLFVIFAQLLFSLVLTSVDNKQITIGDNVTFTITVQGNNPEFPNINKIGVYRVLGTSSSSQTFFVNGKYIKKISRSYVFSPTKSMTIPSFNIKENGKISKTQPIKIIVSKNKSISDGGDFQLEASVAKNKLYEFEHTVLKIVFRRNVNSNVSDLKLNMPPMDNFWTKQIGKEKSYKIGNEIRYELTYLISPQKSGKLILPPITINVGKDVSVRDNFFGLLRSNTQYKKYFSNPISIDVSPLPDGVSLVGDFKIKATIDEETVNANEPMNLTIRIQGKGNFEDIPPFDVKVPNVSMYADEPTKFSGIDNGSFEQKLALIAGASYVIEPIKLTFFSLKDNKVKTVQTSKLNIKVNALKNQSQSIISASPISSKKTTNKQVDDDYKTYVYPFMLGFVLAFIISFLLFRGSRWSLKDCICIAFVKKTINAFRNKVSFDDKKALNILISATTKTPEIKEFIEQLEGNIYKNEDIKIDYKKLRALIKSIEISNNTNKKNINGLS